jgi:hypothetical protein
MGNGNYLGRIYTQSFPPPHARAAGVHNTSLSMFMSMIDINSDHRKNTAHGTNITSCKYCGSPNACNALIAKIPVNITAIPNWNEIIDAR